MRTLLNLAHCHGAVLGTSWQLVLATLQVQLPTGTTHAHKNICTLIYLVRQGTMGRLFLLTQMLNICPPLIRQNYIYIYTIVHLYCTTNRLIWSLNWILSNLLLLLTFVNKLHYLLVRQGTFHYLVRWTSLHLVTILSQHLVWILGLKPGVGGALKPGRAVEGPSTVSFWESVCWACILLYVSCLTS